jgi:hypothetical protein
MHSHQFIIILVNSLRDELVVEFLCNLVVTKSSFKQTTTILKKHTQGVPSEDLARDSEITIKVYKNSI